MQTPCGEMIDILSCKTEDEANHVINNVLNKISAQPNDFKKKILNTLKMVKNNQIKTTKDESLLDSYNKIINLFDIKIKDL
jgi:hypothetical protein